MRDICINRHAVCENVHNTTNISSNMEGKIYTLHCLITFSFLFFVSNARCESEDDYWNDVDGPGGRAYSFSTCAYSTEPGYTCLSCSRALHCYPSNFAILVDCPRILPYCRFGRCSRTQGAKCFEDQKSSTSAPVHVLADDMPVSNETAESSTILSADDKVTTQVGLVSVDQGSEGTITETTTAEV